MLKFVPRLLSSGNASPINRKAALQVEALESRTLLSVFTPAQIRKAYGFDQIRFVANGRTYTGDGSGQTIAIVDAYDHPNILSDLKKFDQRYQLPDPVFQKATPQGTPAFDSGWAMEIALDVEWAHAIAPKAKILLVEAKTASGADLLNAVDYARKQTGVVAVSMSWGSSEFLGESSFDSHFTTPAGHLGGSNGLSGGKNLPGGVTFLASSGDSGAAGGPSWPSVSPNVVAVGGTALTISSSGAYASEAGWSGSGGGPSAYVSEPAYQQGVQNSGVRSCPDVSYDADPNTGFYVYDSKASGGQSGWFVVGGTSASAPQWAALVAIASQGRALAGHGSLDGATQTLYALYRMGSSNSATYFHDVTTGNNTYDASTGYDMVTGLGTPIANQVVKALVAATGSGSNLGGFTASASTPTTFHGNLLEQPADPAAPPIPWRAMVDSVFTLPRQVSQPSEDQKPALPPFLTALKTRSDSWLMEFHSSARASAAAKEGELGSDGLDGFEGDIDVDGGAGD